MTLGDQLVDDERADEARTTRDHDLRHGQER
jgi:hypothetical protein